MKITSLLVDYLSTGQLAMYSCPPCEYYSIDQHVNGWEMRAAHSQILVSTEHESQHGKLLEVLPGWLNLLDDDEANTATLIFAVRSDYVIEGQRWIMCGTSVVPNLEFGAPLQGLHVFEALSQHLSGDTSWTNRARDILYEPRQAQRLSFQEGQRNRMRGNRRALDLLQTFLTPEQKAELEAQRYFHVQGQDGALYRIVRDIHRNIFRIVDGLAVQQYCVVLKDSEVPSYDMILAQKFLLESDIERFLELANTWEIPANLQQSAGLPRTSPFMVMTDQAFATG